MKGATVCIQINTFIQIHILLQVPDVTPHFFIEGMQSWEITNTGCVKYKWTKAGWLTPSVPTPGARKTTEKAKCINPFKWPMTKDQTKRGPSEPIKQSRAQLHNETYINTKLLPELYIKVKYKMYTSKITPGM